MRPWVSRGSTGLVAHFSRPETRLAVCEREVELNRRTAPMLYRGVNRITRQDDGTLAIDGSGDLVDAVVAMRRFDEASLLDRQAQAGELRAPLVERLGAVIAAFHENLPAAVRSGGAERTKPSCHCQSFPVPRGANDFFQRPFGFFSTSTPRRTVRLEFTQSILEYVLVMRSMLRPAKPCIQPFS